VTPPTQTQLRLALLLFFLGTGPAFAQELAKPGSDAELKAVTEELKSSAERQSTLAAARAEAIRAEAEMSSRLIAMAKTVQAQEAALTATSKRIDELAREAVIIRSDLAEKQDILSELLVGLQKLERNPPPALVVEPHDVLAALRGALMFGAIVPELRSEAALLAGKLERLEHIRVTMAAEKAGIEAGLAALNRSRADLKDLIAARKSKVTEASTALKAEKKKATELAARAQTLKQLLDRLAAERAATEAAKTAEALAAEQERKRQEEALLRPAEPLSQSRGKLAFPAQGDILRRYGEADGLGGRLKGIAIATGQSAQVIAPAGGRVAFAGPFRSYGQLLILDAGEGYLVLLAGMQEISAEIGQTIRAGEPLGTMGSGPSSVTLLGDQVQDTRPLLYVEFRKSGESIDSGPWWIGARKEASQ
jgi:septal ring factor EnvC (AmiA/AmiB activator)